MTDWFRSLSVLGMAFAAVVVATIGLAAVIVPTAGGERPVGEASHDVPRSPGAAPSVPAQPTAVGGTLAVSGDREGRFVLDREVTEGSYGLAGADGRILFEGGDPVTIGRIQYDGLEFFVDPDDCTVTPGERHDPTGVAGADIRCDSIEDIRGNGTIGLEGRVGVAANLFGLRGDLPDTGGSVALGDVTLTFDSARLTLVPFAGAFGGQVVDDSIHPPAALTFGYDPGTHALSLSEVQYAGEPTLVPAGACSVGEEEIGLLNPHVRVVELSIRCTSIDVPTLGPVPLDGSVIAEIAEPPR